MSYAIVALGIVYGVLILWGVVELLLLERDMIRFIRTVWRTPEDREKDEP